MNAAEASSGFLFARVRAGNADWQHATALAWIAGQLRVAHVPTTPLSARQRAVLAFVESFTAEHGYPPTLREIAPAVGLASPSTAAYQVEQLRRLGYLAYPHKRATYRGAGLARRSA